MSSLVEQARAAVNDVAATYVTKRLLAALADEAEETHRLWVASIGQAEYFEAATRKAEARVAELEAGLRGIASRRCLCDPNDHMRHGGPCCGVAGGRCVTCEARALFDGSTDTEGDDAA